MDEYVTKQELNEAISEIRREMLSLRNSLNSMIATKTGEYLDTLGFSNKLLKIEHTLDTLSKKK